MRPFRIRAYAKLNLFLDIIGRKPNGYHELKTVMQTIDLYDELEITLSEGTGINITSDSRDIPLDSSNIVYKGIQAMINYAGLEPECRIDVNIVKHIPTQAGLGGGSADCAAVIVAMNELFHLGLSDDELCTAGAMCGADVPFCIKGGTMLCEGIGEKMMELTPLPDDMLFAVVKPEDSISTPEAYRLFDTFGSYSAGDYEKFSSALVSRSAKQIGESLYNAFTQSGVPDSVTEEKSRLKSLKAYGSEMTGSGSAVFGIFDSIVNAENAVKTSDCDFGGVYRPIKKGWKIV